MAVHPGLKGDKRLKSFRFLFVGVFFLYLILALAAPAAAAQSETIIVYGDSRTNHDVHRKIVGHIIIFKPVAVFSTGDLVNDGRVPDEWVVFNNIIAPIRRTSEFYPVLGNHERNADLYFKNFQLPGNERWYSVRKGPIIFFMLDSNSLIGPGSNQHTWLENELRSVPKDVKFVAAVYHHPAISSGPYPDEKTSRSASCLSWKSTKSTSCSQGTSTSTNARSKMESPTSQPAAAAPRCTSNSATTLTDRSSGRFTTFASCR